mmetsp:Transcript_143216/g.266917  ORF Transcript_143216/g.266917 Transcript_143216/m.266917 type:complete len:214 (-) Transcript_143216:56-697(-)
MSCPTLSQSPMLFLPQAALSVEPKFKSIFGVIGITAYSKRQAISNLHMSVRTGRSTEVAKSISHTASKASIMMFAAFKSPWASPTRGQRSTTLPSLTCLDKFSSIGRIVPTTISFRLGISTPKCSLYISRMCGSGGYWPLAVYGLNLLSLPFSVYQPQSSGWPIALCKPAPPFRSAPTTPPGPKVSASTLCTFPKGRISPGAGAVPTMICSLS